MIFFYWLVAVMTLDQHWLWGREIFGQLTIIKLLGILCLFIALFKMGAGNAFPRRLYDSSPTRWFIAFLVLLAGGAMHSLPANVSNAYLHLISILSLWLTALILVDSGVHLRRTLLLAVGSAAFASLYAVRQHSLQGGATDRAAGIFSDSNQYALVVGLWLPMAYLWAFSKRPRWERLFCLGSLVVISLGTFLAASRGGFMGLGAAFLYVIVRSNRPVRSLIAVSALTMPLLLWPSSPFLRRLTNPSHGDRLAQDARLVVWKAGLRMIERHPFVGVGMHNFKSQVLEYEGQDEQVISVAHNSYLEIAAEMGTPALLVYLGLLGTTFTALERVRRLSERRNMVHLSRMALGLQAGLISYVFSSFFLSAWFEKMFWLLIFLSIALFRMEGKLKSFRARKVRRFEEQENDSIAVCEFAETGEQR